MMESGTCQVLYYNVIKENLCTLCGGCVVMRPYLVVHMGRVILRDVCSLTRGRCGAFCPRFSFDLDNVNQMIFGTPYTWDALGMIKEIFMARSLDTAVRPNSQDAGTVTTLIC